MIVRVARYTHWTNGADVLALKSLRKNAVPRIPIETTAKTYTKTTRIRAIRTTGLPLRRVEAAGVLMVLLSPNDQSRVRLRRHSCTA
jgi:hypothetical protein